jgi:PAS domain S-box-containing protein
VIGIFCEGFDVTDAHRANEALRRSEELNRRVLSSSDDCIKLLNLDGRLETMSEGGQRALAIRDLAPFIGSVWADAFEPEGRPAASAAIAEARAGRTARFEARLRTQAGVVRDWDTVLTPVVDDEGRPERILALSRDITNRREAEALLRDSEVRRTFLLALGDLTRSLADPAAIVEATTRALGEHLGANRVAYAEIDEAAGHATTRGGWTDGTAAHLPETVRLGDFGGRIVARLRSGRTLRVDDVRDDEHTRDCLGALEAIEVGALMSVPLVRDGRFVANLNVHQDRPRAWTDAEVELVETVAERTWEAVERSRADAALRASGARLAAIFAEAPVGLSEVDLDGRFQSVNAELCAMLGRSREEVIAGTIAEITHPEDLAISLENFRGTIATGRPVSFDKRYVRRDGTLIRANSNLTRLDDEDGKPRGILAVTVDLTERLAQQAALEEETRTLETLNRTGAQLAGELDLDRLLQTVTDASVELTGAEFGAYFHNVMDETGERLHLFTLSGAEREAFLAMGRPRATAIFGPTFRNETIIRSDDILADPRYGLNAPHKGMPEGHLPVRSYLAIPVVSRTGEVLGGLLFGHGEPGRFTERHERLMRGLAAQAAVAIDNARLYRISQTEIEERRLAEARLRELNDTLEQRVAERTADRDRMWRLSTDLMLVARFDATITAVNPAWTGLLGWADGELLGRSFIDLVHPDDMHSTLDEAGRLADGQTTLRFENRYRCRDGSYRHLSWTAVPGDGLIHAVARDVTAEKEAASELATAQEALRQAQKMEAMGQLTGGVAHDFNNLLTPIVGTLDMLQRRGVGGEREQRLIGGAMHSADRAKTLVQRLLAFARRQPLQASAVDVGELTRGMADLIASTTGPQIQVMVDAPDDLPPARADANQLEMAILNLAVNARDAMPEGGTLRISVAAATVGGGHRSSLKPGRYLHLSVADTGTGMDAATLARAIEPFFSTKGVGKGTGLGLSMVHGLASQLGGAVTIHSAPGLGTNVELWLPQAEAMVPRSEPHIEAEAPAPGRGTVLLVDDEDVVRMSTADMLVELGYAVVEAGSAEEAMRLLERGLAPDIVVTDHLMPGMSGTELARRILAERPATGVLVVSGYAEAVGVSPDLPRLTKPFRSADLAASLAALG